MGFVGFGTRHDTADSALATLFWQRARSSAGVTHRGNPQCTGRPGSAAARPLCPIDQRPVRAEATSTLAFRKSSILWVTPSTNRIQSRLPLGGWRVQLIGVENAAAGFSHAGSVAAARSVTVWVSV